jgi:hypothetical protein
MTISTKTFPNLQPGVSAADDLRVRTPINQALQWLGEGLPNEINDHFDAVSSSVSNYVSVYASARPAFRAFSSASQPSLTSTVFNQVVLDTETYDTGDYFSSSTWTPPLGKYRVSFGIEWSNTNGVDNENLEAQVRVAGTQISQWKFKRSGTGAQTIAASCLVNVNGSQAVTLFTRKTGAGDGTLVAGSTATWFEGEATA